MGGWLLIAIGLAKLLAVAVLAQASFCLESSAYFAGHTAIGV